MKDDESIEDLRTREERYSDLQNASENAYWSQVGPFLIIGMALFTFGVIVGFAVTKLLNL